MVKDIHKYKIIKMSTLKYNMSSNLIYKKYNLRLLASVSCHEDLTKPTISQPCDEVQDHVIICGLHEDFMKIERFGLELRIVCCVTSLIQVSNISILDQG